MLSRRLLKPNSIRFFRPLRPPNDAPPRPRPFTQNAPLLLVAKHTPRPQLPYLSQPSFRRGPQGQLARLITTETREYVRDLSYNSVKYTIIIAVFLLLGTVASSGIEMEKREREKATPSDWSFGLRHILRQTRALMKAVEELRSPIVDWPLVGSYLKECVIRLEDPKRDGAGVILQDGGDGSGEQILIADVGKAGYDIDGKSYEWKTGYFEVLLLSAVAAEHLENIVLDTKRKAVFPKEVVIGPSNPDPRPVPSYFKHSAPNEEDCEPFYDPPETFYMKILTTKGFTTRQKLEAVEGYANWLEFKGLSGAAEEMYRWGLDIAKAAVPEPLDVDQALDPMTNMLKADGIEKATPNLLRASTALATHHARTGNIASALPMLLSILRARRSAPLSLDLIEEENTAPPPSTDIGAAMAMVKSWMTPPKFPPEPPSGDTPLVRTSVNPTCEEGELMLYIGEILFAASPGRGSEGVGWTRQGVLVAEANLQSSGGNRVPASGTEVEKVENRKCKECLLTGVKNWEAMLEQMTEQRASSSSREGGRSAGWLEWKGWFGRGGDKGKTLDEVGVGVLEEELRQVARLKDRIVRENIDVELSKGQYEGAPWFGF